MNTLTILITLVTMFMIGFIGPVRAETGSDTNLRQSVVVDNQYIKLGDLFTNVGDKADTNVAYAPAPGRQTVLNARWLYQLAKAHGVDWRPLEGADQSVIERDSNVIMSSDIAKAISAELSQRGIAEQFDVDLASQQLELHVGADKLAAVEIRDLSYDETSGQFAALIAYPANDPAAQHLRIAGRALPAMEVPVLARQVLPGEIIQETDLNWVRMRINRIQRDTITEADDLLGKTPVRRVRLGKPVRVSQVQDPILVERRSVVTMLLRRPSLVITAQGKALENGALGQVVRVANLQSNTIVDAVVIGAGKVTVPQSLPLKTSE